MSTESKTPRTDGELLSWNLSSQELINACNRQSLGFNGVNIQNRVVDANFARTLELELAEALKEADRQTEIADAMTEYQPDAKRELELKQQLAEANHKLESALRREQDQIILRKVNNKQLEEASRKLEVAKETLKKVYQQIIFPERFEDPLGEACDVIEHAFAALNQPKGNE